MNSLLESDIHRKSREALVRSGSDFDEFNAPMICTKGFNLSFDVGPKASSLCVIC
jgi:hypothetical protein